MADTKTAPDAKPAAAAGAAPAKAAKPKAEPKPPRYAPEGTITLLKDKEGKVQYGPVTDEKATPLPTKNPKRAGTKSATWFANYKDGMTIAELSKAFEKTGGSMNSNLDWDIKHGFVQYNPPKKAA